MDAIAKHIHNVSVLLSQAGERSKAKLPARTAPTAELVADAVEREHQRDVVLDLRLPRALEEIRGPVAQTLHEQAEHLRRRLAWRKKRSDRLQSRAAARS